MKTIRYAGLFLFLGALGIFFTLFFSSSYTLTEEIFTSNVKPEHQETLRPELVNVLNKEYGLSIPFANALDNAVSTVNEKMRAAQQWDKVIYDDYIGSLTRASANGLIKEHTTLLFILVFVVGAIGALMFIIPQAKLAGPPGIKHNGIFFNALNNRGWVGILTGTILILFYVFLYFYPAYITNWIILVDPVQKLLNPSATSSQWFLYGFLYTFAVLVMGIRMIIKYSFYFIWYY